MVIIDDLWWSNELNLTRTSADINHQSGVLQTVDDGLEIVLTPSICKQWTPNLTTRCIII